jgi:hypothetical protein
VRGTRRRSSVPWFRQAAWREFVSQLRDAKDSLTGAHLAIDAIYYAEAA